MKKLLILTILFWLYGMTAYAITFNTSNISVERKTISYIYFYKSWFYGYGCMIESNHPGEFTQLTNDLALWRDKHNVVKDGSPISITETDIVMDSGYVTAWFNDGKYNYTDSSMTNLKADEQVSILNEVNKMPECKIVYLKGTNTTYKCN